MSMTPTQSAGHTKEPWTDDGYCDWTVIGADGKPAFDDGSAGGEYGASCTPETRDRIVACVNALAGIPDPDAAIRQAREVMKDAILQIEYLHDKFRPTGTGNAVIANLAAALAALTPETKDQ